MATDENPGAFPQTRWSLVLDAQDDDPQALADLCGVYWFPLYCYARRLRDNSHDAEDLTQAFFQQLLSRDGFGKARAERGKLRSFLLVALRNFANSEWRRERSNKRGGEFKHVEIDTLEGEARYALELHDELTPELEFDRAWARQLLSQAIEQLAAAYATAGKGELFEALRGQLAPGGAVEPYAEIATRLGISEGSVRLGAFKMRKRYRDQLKSTIADTVTSEAEVEEELRELRAIFGD